ncbi:hypothetical protein B0H10DRAFT_1953533 [Mycena sp. CBHHK59/15]|nr:hypothetical protein B0H10DRAFT_1953533 [Mycena sp. CBHHK59/15]
MADTEVSISGRAGRRSSAREGARSSRGILIPQPSKPIPVSRSVRTPDSLIPICGQLDSLSGGEPWPVPVQRQDWMRGKLYGEQADTRPGAGLSAGSVKTTRVRGPRTFGRKGIGGALPASRASLASCRVGVCGEVRWDSPNCLLTQFAGWERGGWANSGRASDAGLWDSSIGWATNGCGRWDWREAVRLVWADGVADATHAVLGGADESFGASYAPALSGRDVPAPSDSVPFPLHVRNRPRWLYCVGGGTERRWASVAA